MPEITTIAAAIAGVKNAYEMAKAINATDKTFERAEFKLEMSKLMEALYDAREKMLEAKELIIEKDETIRKLEAQLAVKQSLVFKNNSYWTETESGQDGPFCTQCWDMDGKLVRKTHQKGTEHWYCVTHGGRVATVARLVRG